MKIECIVPNVWTSNRNIKRGEVDDVSDQEAKMLEGRGQAKILEVKRAAKKPKQPRNR